MTIQQASFHAQTALAILLFNQTCWNDSSLGKQQYPTFITASRYNLVSPESALEDCTAAELSPALPVGPAWPLPGGCSMATNDVLGADALPCTTSDHWAH